MENLDFNEWLKGEDEIEIHAKYYEQSKRIEFLTQELFNSQQSQIKTFHAVAIVVERQNELANTMSQLTDLMTKMISNNN
ncbi:MAG: hypothetical protein QNL61_07110 [Crocinitomicaceae bacterium]